MKLKGSAQPPEISYKFKNGGWAPWAPTELRPWVRQFVSLVRQLEF